MTQSADTLKVPPRDDAGANTLDEFKTKFHTAVVALRASVDGNASSTKAQKEKLDAALNILEQRIQNVRNSTQLSAEQRTILLAELEGAKGLTDPNAIMTTIQTVTSQLPSDNSEFSYEVSSGGALNAQRALSAATQEHINKLCNRSWSVESPKALREFTGALIEEKDPGIHKYRAEHLARAAEADPLVKSALRTIAEAPPEVKRAVLTEQSNDEAKVSGFAKRAPEGSREQHVLKEAGVLRKDPRVHAAIDQYEKDHNLDALDAALQPARISYNVAGNKALRIMRASGDPDDKRTATAVDAMGGFAAADKRADDVQDSTVRSTRARRVISTGAVVDPNSEVGKDAAALKVQDQAQDIYDTFGTAMTIAIRRGRSYNRETSRYQALSETDKEQYVKDTLMADPQASAILKKQTPEEQHTTISGYVKKLGEGKIKGVNDLTHLMYDHDLKADGKSAEKRKELLDGSHNKELMTALMGHGWKAMESGDYHDATQTAAMVRKQMMKEGWSKAVSEATETALNVGAYVGSSKVGSSVIAVVGNVSKSIQSGTEIENAKQMAMSALHKTENLLHNAGSAVSSMIWGAPPAKAATPAGPSLQQQQTISRGFIDKNHDGKIDAKELAAARADADKNHDGKVDAKELDRYNREHKASAAAKEGEHLKQMQGAASKIMDNNHDGKVSAAELAAARKEADKNHDGKVSAAELGAYLKAHGVTLGAECNSMPPHGAKSAVGKSARPH